jgi:putative tryptophan/tyrosine transport system substrate-binding protein
MAPELSEKRLEVVREMLPGVRRVAALWDPTTGASQVSTTERAARTLKLELHILEARRREDVVGALPLSRRSSLSQLNTGSRQSINGKNMWKQGPDLLWTEP